MGISEKINYKKILKYFNKGEQVFIGFMDGSTHGFISSISEEGLGIRQIGNAKEIIYDWGHFVFIAHPGVWAKKSGDISKATVLELKPTREALAAYSAAMERAIRPKLEQAIGILPDKFWKQQSKQKLQMLYEEQFNDDYMGVESHLPKIHYKMVTDSHDKGKAANDGFLMVGEDISQLQILNNISTHIDAGFRSGVIVGHYMVEPIATLVMEGARDVYCPARVHRELANQPNDIRVRISVWNEYTPVYWATKIPLEPTLVRSRAYTEMSFRVVALGAGEYRKDRLHNLSPKKILEVVKAGPVYYGDPWMIDGKEIEHGVLKSTQGFAIVNAGAERIYEVESGA